MQIIKLTLYFPIFLFELLLFKLFDIKNNEKTYQTLIKLFSLTRGKSNHIINLFLSFPKIKKNNLEIKDSNEDLNLDEIKIKNNLDKNGYSLEENVLDEKKISEIFNKVLKINGKYMSDNYNSNDQELLNLQNPKAIKFKHDSNELLKISEIQELIVNKKILKIVQNYLDSHPILDYVDCFWTFEDKKKYQDSQAAQYWHFDMDRVKFLKLFIFIKDCDFDNGPHYYISGSHLTQNIPGDLLKPGYQRLEDKMILDNFKKENIKCFTAKKGSFLFEDTIGFHKGTPVKSDSRLLLMIQYSTNLFGSKSQKFNIDKKYFNSHFNYAYENYPLLFKNFNFKK